MDHPVCINTLQITLINQKKSASKVEHVLLMRLGAGRASWISVIERLGAAVKSITSGAIPGRATFTSSFLTNYIYKCVCRAVSCLVR